MSETFENIPDFITIPPESREQFLPLRIPKSGGLHDRGIYHAGISRVSPPYEVLRRNPGYHLVLYTISGHAQVVTRQFRQTVQPGELFVCPAHNATNYKPCDDWHIAWFHLIDTAPWTFLRELSPRIRTAFSMPKIVWAMEGLIEESISSQPGGNSATACYSDLIMFYLERELEVSESRVDRTVRDKLRQLWNRVNAHLQHRWQVEELSDFIGCSTACLYRYTAAEYGTTPMRMVARLRIECAKELLRSTDYTLSHIAALVGYDTPFALSRAFKSHTGRYPRDYRNSYRL